MYPAIKRSIDWLLGEMDPDKDLFPAGTESWRFPA
jgi:hypothetical protein